MYAESSRAVVLLAAILLTTSAVAQSVPKAVTYQGKLTDATGQPVADGNYQVQFKLYTVAVGGVAFWTSALLTVQTNGGVFTTILQTIDPSDLTGKTDVYLETIVAGQTLAPRVKLVSAPFALRAGDLDLPFTGNISSGTYGFTLNQTGIGGGIEVYHTGGGGRAGWFRINNAANNMAALQGQTNGSGAAVYGHQSGSGDGVVGAVSGAGDAVEGMASGTGRAGYFHIDSAGNSAAALEASTAGSGSAVYAATGGSGRGVYAYKSAGSGAAVEGYTAGTGRAGYFRIVNASSSSDAIEASTTGTGSAGRFQIDNSGSNADALEITTNADGDGIDVRTSGGGHAIFAKTTGILSAGYFWVSNPDSGWPAVYAITDGKSNAVYGAQTGTGHGGAFTVSNTANSYAAVYGSSNGTGDTFRGYMSGSGHAGFFSITNSANTMAAVQGTTSGTGEAVLGTNSSSGNEGYLASSNYGAYGKHDSSGNYGLLGSSNYGVYGRALGTSDYAVYGYASNSTAGAYMYGVRGYADAEYGRAGHFATPGVNGIGVYTYASGTNGWGIHAKGGSSGYAGVFDGNVLIRDRSTLATLMELGTGLDYAEGFDVSEEHEIAAGSVLVIDSDNPGKLTLSSKAYDRRVAGIVAGAKGLGSGVRLGADRFDRDVALAGRVYCNVDATKAAVQPGDLLTTSSTPGHAMKVTDYRRAQGATLGKAMEPLEKGKKGQILVLVALQ